MNPPALRTFAVVKLIVTFVAIAPTFKLPGSRVAEDMLPGVKPVIIPARFS